MATLSDVKYESGQRLAEVAESYGVRLKRSGRYYKACCPIHNDKTPSFYIDTKKARWNCYGCGEYGDAIDLAMKLDGSTFVEAAKKIAGMVGMALEFESDGVSTDLYAKASSLADFFSSCLKSNPAASEYVSSRGLGAMAKGWRLGYCPSNFVPREGQELGIMDDYGRCLLRGRLIFPIIEPSGRVVSFAGRTMSGSAAKYVNGKETEIFIKSRTLYGRGRTAAEGYVCVEGYTDAIAARGLFPNHNVVASCGTAFTQHHAAYMFSRKRSAVFLFDGDKAGVDASLRSAKLAFETGMDASVSVLPEGEDPFSMTAAGRGDEVVQSVTHALPYMEMMLKEAGLRKANMATVIAHVLKSVAKIDSTMIQGLRIRRLSALTGIDYPSLYDEMKHTK